MKNISLFFILIVNLLIYSSCTLKSSKEAKNWPQFRGNNCSGIAAENARPPIEFNANNLSWKIVLPEGHSSPVIWNDKIFVTGFIKDNSELQIICIKRKTGKIIWKQSIFPERIEGYHTISNAAMASPATDGEHVYVYFGSYGILCYDFNGELVWDFKIKVHPYRWGVASSLVIHEDKLILNRDISNERQLIALNKRTGEIIWKTDLTNAKNNIWTTSFSTPVIYGNQIILHRSAEIASYSAEDGHRIWWISYLTSGVSTPVTNKDIIYIGTWHNFSENELRGNLPKYFDFNKLVNDFDASQDGLIQKDELPDSLLLFNRPEISDIETSSNSVLQAIDDFDKNKNGAIDKSEWDETINWIKSTFYKEAGLIALKPEAEGELTFDKIVWREPEKVPEVPSPVYYNNLVYMCCDGGILTCMDANNGKIVYRERIGAAGSFIASPVIANGYIYLTSAKGVITVIKAGDKFNIVKQNNLKENVFATPAIIGNSFYIRAQGHLYAFI